MKIKVLGLSVLVALMAFSANAEFYVSAGAGAVKNTGDVYKNFDKLDYHTSAAYSLAFGYDLPVINAFRFEGELLHNRSKLSKSKGKVVLNALMANAYLDISLFPDLLFTPYIGAGIGYGRLEDTNVIPMQGIVGIDADISVLPVVASAEYHFMQTNTDGKRAHERDKYYAHMLMLKLRYEF